VPDQIPLFIAVAAVALAIFWLVKKLLKLAILAALAGLLAWVWYFYIRAG